MKRKRSNEKEAFNKKGYRGRKKVDSEIQL